MLNEAAINGFRANLRGELLRPGDDGYDGARMIHNAMIDRRPALIAHCTGTADVIACVHFAREHNLLVSVRGGGHSIAGKAVCDGGLMVDLSRMKGIRVDSARRRVRAQPGLTLGEFDRETQAFGLATTMGVVSKTGIAGLTLGGGLGWLMRKHGLACDNLLSADIVLADGQLLTATATQNEDLFWGLRGGGGNFGVVTSLEYRLHPVGPVLGGGVFYPAEKTREVLRFYRDYATSSPDELSTQVATITLPDVGRMVGVAGCYCGTMAEGEKLLKPLRTFGPPAVDLFAPIPYVQLQSMLDPFFPPRTACLHEGKLPEPSQRHSHRYFRRVRDRPVTLHLGGPRTSGWRALPRTADGDGFRTSLLSLQFFHLVKLGGSGRLGEEHSLESGFLGCDASVHGGRLLRQLPRG